MKGSRFYQFFLYALLTACTSLSHAGMPVLTFAPLTPTSITVADNTSATVQYRVTNQSKKTHTWIMRSIPGIRLVNGPGNCSNPFVLGYQQSCLLTLSINGAELLGDVHGGPVVCVGGNANFCYRPSLSNSLNIIKGEASSFTVGGSLFGLVGTVEIENGADTITMTADGSFTFPTPLTPGSIYFVSVKNSPPNQTCTVTNGTGVITNANVTNVMVNCSTNTRTIGGSVSGLAFGESVELQNNGGDNLIQNSDGSFTFSTPVAQGATYNVTVLTQPSTQFCTVNNGSGIVGNFNITNVQVICANLSYTVGGNVSGATGPLSLQNNGTDDLPLSGDGSFTFNTPVANGAAYSVTVSAQPAGQTCIVTNGSGTISGANVTNVAVSCADNALITVNTSELALSTTGIDEFGIPSSSGIARTVTLTNNGPGTALNLAVNEPVWPSMTTSSTTCGSSLPFGGTCTITVTPGDTASSDGSQACTAGTAALPSTIVVTSNNAPNVAIDVFILGYGCIYQGGHVFSLDDTTPTSTSVGGKVMTTSNQASPSSGVFWASGTTTSASYDIIPGIDAGNTGGPTHAAAEALFNPTYFNSSFLTFPPSSSFAVCDGKTEGMCNSANILVLYNTYRTNYNTSVSPPFFLSFGPTSTFLYSAGLCTDMINGLIDWYLPAICEMGYDRTGVVGTGCGSASLPLIQNIQKSIIDNGLNLLQGSFWSSTENVATPESLALKQVFDPTLPEQLATSKSDQLGVRCVRFLN